MQLLAARDVPPKFFSAHDDAGLELAGGILEPLDFERERARPFHQRRMRGLRFSRDARLVRGGLAGLEQLALRRGQLLVRRALLDLDALNRVARLVLAMLLRAQFLFGAAALEGGLVLLPRHAIGRVAGGRHLEVVADDGLLLPVELGLQRGDRRFRRGNRHVEAGRFLEQPDEGRVPRVGALAQLLDLALRRQDAARLVARAPFDPVRAAEDFPLARHGHAAGLTSRVAGLVSRGRHEDVPDLRTDGICGGPCEPDQGPQTRD